MILKGIYLSMFYCLCYDTDISTDMSEDQVVEERYPDLNEEEDIRLDAIREELCENRGKMAIATGLGKTRTI